MGRGVSSPRLLPAFLAVCMHRHTNPSPTPHVGPAHLHPPSDGPLPPCPAASTAPGWAPASPPPRWTRRAPLMWCWPGCWTLPVAAPSWCSVAGGAPGRRSWWPTCVWSWRWWPARLGCRCRCERAGGPCLPARACLMLLCCVSSAMLCLDLPGALVVAASAHGPAAALYPAAGQRGAAGPGAPGVQRQAGRALVLGQDGGKGPPWAGGPERRGAELRCCCAGQAGCATGLHHLPRQGLGSSCRGNIGNRDSGVDGGLAGAEQAGRERLLGLVVLRPGGDRCMLALRPSPDHCTSNNLHRFHWACILIASQH